MGVVAANAAIVVDLNNGDDGPQTTLTLSNLDSTVSLSATPLANTVGLVSSDVSGANGSFAVTLTASTDAVNPSEWNFVTGPNSVFATFGIGWGPYEPPLINGNGNWHEGEAFLLKFNTTNLVLDAEQTLVFSVSTKDSGDAVSIYQRSGPTTGTNVLNVTTVANGFHTSINVDGLAEFAIVQTDGVNLLNGLSFDVVGPSVPDTDPPSPDPATWAAPPAEDGPFAITMTATTGEDVSDVEYFFKSDIGNPAGGTDSGWQSSSTYSDTGLLPNTTYSYYVSMRDTASTPNHGGWSSIASATTAAAMAGRTNGPPNVVFIYADDLGNADISRNASPGGLAYTPSIDRICNEGIYLSGYMTHHVCSPSRAGMLTGRHYTEVGSGQMIGGVLDNSVSNIAKDFKAAGYSTACFGKWHNSKATATRDGEGVNTYGFDEWAGFYGGGQNYHDRTDENWWINETRSDEIEGYLTYVVQDDALNFIDEHAHEPFFLYIPHGAVHSPYDILNTDLEELCNIVSSNHPSLAWNNVGELVSPSTGRPIKDVLKMYCSPGEEFDMNALDDPLPGYRELVYCTMVYAIDKSTEAILDRLDAYGLSTNTIVVFSSDNGGTGRGDNTPFRGFKQSLWEGGIHVPAAIWWPGVLDANQAPYASGDNSYTNMTQYFDLYPTLVNAAGQTVLAAELDGLNLTSNLLSRTPARAGFDSCYYGLGQDWTALRNDRWKLHFNRLPGNQMLELYDLNADIGETTDVAAANPGVRDTMIGLLDDWFAAGDVSASYMTLRGTMIPPYLEPAPVGDIMEVMAVQTAALSDPDTEGVYIEFAQPVWSSESDQFIHAGDVMQYDIYVADDSDQVRGMFSSPSFYYSAYGTQPLFRSSHGIGLDDGMVVDRILPKGEWVRCAVGMGEAAAVRQLNEIFIGLLAPSAGAYHFYMDNVVIRKSDGTVRAVCWNSGDDTRSLFSYTLNRREYTLSNLLAQPGIAFSSISANAVDLSGLPTTPEEGSRYSSWAESVGMGNYDPAKAGPTNELPLFAEYAIGSDPTTVTEGLIRGTNAPTAQQLASYDIPVSLSNGYMTLIFDFNRDANDVELVVAESTNLVDWTESLVLHPPYTDTSGLASSSTVVQVFDNAPGSYSADTTRVTARSTFTIDDELKGFIALKVRPAVAPAETPLELNADSHRGILLEWSGSVENGEFIIERSPAGSGSFVEITRTENYQFTDTSAANGQTYDYRVRAVNAAGATDWSNTAFITR